jgi:hypothetical protein
LACASTGARGAAAVVAELDERAQVTRTLDRMQLRTARLCLDCEEVHEGQQCPVCASESFVYLTRWVPVEERRTRRPRPPSVAAEPSRTARWAKRGAVGIAAIAASRWLWQATRRPDDVPPVLRKRVDDDDAGVAGSSETAR